MTEQNKGETFLYPKTVYYQKGKVRFRFKNQDSIKAFIAESKIIFEVKTIDKYSNDFFIETDTPKKIPSTGGNDSLPLVLMDTLGLIISLTQLKEVSCHIYVG